MSHSPSQGVPEDSVAAILARAAELDRTATPTVGPDAIRTAAIEAGISPSAVDRALEEYAAAGLPVAPPSSMEDSDAPEEPRWRRWLRKSKRPFAVAGLSLVVAGFIADAAPDAEPLLLLGFGAWIFHAVRLALRRRRTRVARGYVAEMVAIAMGSFFGFAMVNGDEDVMVSILMVGAVLLTLGSLVIKVRRRRSPRGPVPELGEIPG